MGLILGYLQLGGLPLNLKCQVWIQRKEKVIKKRVIDAKLDALWPHTHTLLKEATLKRIKHRHIKQRLTVEWLHMCNSCINNFFQQYSYTLNYIIACALDLKITKNLSTNTRMPLDINYRKSKPNGIYVILLLIK